MPISATCRPCVAVLVSMTAVATNLNAQTSGPILEAHQPASSGAVQSCTLADGETVAECGTFRVMEGQGGARTLDLSFVRIAATADGLRTTDAVVVLPGGPGDALTGAAHFLAALYEPLTQARDLIVFDPRGAGGTSVLSCEIPFPGGERSRWEHVFPPDFVAACREYLEASADLTEYTTEKVVDDLDLLRDWLGYESLNLIGISYGTRTAQAYARRFPARTRTMILNGVVPLGVPAYANTATNLEGALTTLLAECASESDCASAYPDTRARIDALATSLETRSVAVETPSGPQPFTRDALSYALRGLLYVRGADLPNFVARAADGDLQPLADFYRSRVDWIGNGYPFGAHLSALCAEDLALVDDAEIGRLSTGTFAGPSVARAYADACRAWPVAPLEPNPVRPLESEVPSLLLAGSHDPATPPAWAEQVAAGLINRVVIVVPRGGHIVWNSCIGKMAERLVALATVEGLDQSCIDAMPSPVFTLPGGSLGEREALPEGVEDLTLAIEGLAPPVRDLEHPPGATSRLRAGLRGPVVEKALLGQASQRQVHGADRQAPVGQLGQFVPHRQPVCTISEPPHGKQNEVLKLSKRRLSHNPFMGCKVVIRGHEIASTTSLPEAAPPPQTSRRRSSHGVETSVSPAAFSPPGPGSTHASGGTGRSADGGLRQASWRQRSDGGAADPVRRGRSDQPLRLALSQ